MSSFTQDAERDLFIESTLIPSKFAICSIEESLFSPSFPGTIPTEDISPFPAILGKKLPCMRDFVMRREIT